MKSLITKLLNIFKPKTTEERQYKAAINARAVEYQSKYLDDVKVNILYSGRC